MMTRIKNYYILVMAVALLRSLHYSNGNPVDIVNEANNVNIGDELIDNNNVSDITEEPPEDTTDACWGPVCSIVSTTARVASTTERVNSTTVKVASTTAKVACGGPGCTDFYTAPTFAGYYLSRYSTSSFPPQNTTVACSYETPTGCPPPTHKYIWDCSFCYWITSPFCPCKNCWNGCIRPNQAIVPCPCNDCEHGCNV